MASTVSELQKVRTVYTPKLPAALKGGACVNVKEGERLGAFADAEKIQALFPNTYGTPNLEFAEGKKGATLGKPVNVGVILSGGQAPGGHNVIAGLFDGLKSLHPESKLYGFTGGPSGQI